MHALLCVCVRDRERTCVLVCKCMGVKARGQAQVSAIILQMQSALFFETESLTEDTHVSGTGA